MLSRLRVKIKSLAVEAEMIRFEERKLVGPRIGPQDFVPALAGAGLPVIDHAAAKLLPPEEKQERRHQRKRRTGQLSWLRRNQRPPAEIEAKQAEYESLHRHRTHDVRREARAALLAYSYLRKRPYLAVEPGPKPGKAGKPAPRSLVIDLVARFGPQGVPRFTIEREVDAWLGVQPAAVDPAALAAGP